MWRRKRAYRSYDRYRQRRHKDLFKKSVFGLIGLAVIAVAVFFVFANHSSPADKLAKKEKQVASQLNFDSSVAKAEQASISGGIAKQNMKINGSVAARITTSLQKTAGEPTLAVYVPVMNAYTTKLSVTKAELATMPVKVPQNTDETVKTAIAKTLGISKLGELTQPLSDIPDGVVAFVPESDLSVKVRLLTFDGEYYLDNFDSGAVFRQVSFSGGNAESLAKLSLTSLPTKADTLKVNMTGVTALTRKYIIRIAGGTSPDYFSAAIAGFLKNADIVHTSNEISFDNKCHVVPTGLVFCAPPSAIETLKSAGINLIELTGNHNNNFGALDNQQTIEEYHKLGWHTFGGGVNAEEAAKPYVADMKGSKVAFFGYNYADSPSGYPIATDTHAGANEFDFEKIKSDIASAKQKNEFVIVDVQFWECYSYPAYHTELPSCDQPIADQEKTFRKIIDLGADMVIGTQAHQPQTYELYKGKQIYYGIGNLFFDQIEWPGTERGIILTHYFYKNELLQTRLTPTIYGDNLQVHKMTDAKEISYFLNRLKAARAVL